MIILAYIWVICLILSVLFIIVAGVVEKNFDESHPVKIWWRKHVIGIAPNDKDI
jgi:hypothetical protein